MFTESNKEKKKITKHYYILSNKFDINTFVKITREHLNIECGLRLDVILDEDHPRSRVGNSIGRKIVFNLTKLDNSMGTNLTLKKKMTRYTGDFKNIENLIFQVLPSSN